VTNGSSDNGPGRNLRSSAGLVGWYGVWFGEWARSGLTPLWFEVRPQLSISYDTLTAALGVLRTPGPGVMRGPTGGVCVPLLVPRGAERGTAFNNVHSLMAASGSLLPSADAP